MTESYEVKKQNCRVCHHQGGDGKRYSPDRRYSVKCFHCNGLGSEFINVEDNLRIPPDDLLKLRPNDLGRFISLLRARFLAHEDVDLYNAISEVQWSFMEYKEKTNNKIQWLEKRIEYLEKQ